MIEKSDLLNIDGGLSDAVGFAADLVELPVAPFLRALAPGHVMLIDDGDGLAFALIGSLPERRLPLPDHFDYAALPWPEATREVVCTEKDAVKLDPARLGGTRVWVLPLDLRLPDSLVADLLTLLKRRPS